MAHRFEGLGLRWYGACHGRRGTYPHWHRLYDVQTSIFGYRARPLDLGNSLMCCLWGLGECQQGAIQAVSTRDLQLSLG